MKITIRLKDRDDILELQEATALTEILKRYENEFSYPIYAAKVNNAYRALTHKLTHDSFVEFVEMRNQATWVIYQNSLELLYIKAVHDIMGKDAFVTIENSLNKGLYTHIKPQANEETVSKIEDRMHELVDEDLPIIKEHLTKDELLYLSNSLKLSKTTELIETVKESDSFEVYSLSDEVAIFYSLMVPSTGYLKLFELRPYRNGILLRYPHMDEPSTLPEYEDQTLLYNAFVEADKWGKLMNINFLSDLNERIVNKDYEELFLMQEALHEKHIAEIADMIKERKRKIVLICGPSSSGKTTFAKRLCIQLQVIGLKPFYLGTDDYFVEEDENPVDENGEKDLESIKAVDTKLFVSNLKDLMAGKEVDIPSFDFVKKTKIFGKRITKLQNDGVIVIEGIHALNRLLTEGIDDDQKFKIYISPFTPIGIDHHNRIPTTDARMLRRLVRDHQFRGRSPQNVLEEWVKVRKSENVNIFPFNKEADVFFNSNCIYELAVLKKYAEPLLKQISRDQSEYAEAERMLNLLRYIDTIDNDEDIANNSILREFIGGSVIVK